MFLAASDIANPSERDQEHLDARGHEELANEMMSYTESFVDGYYFSFSFKRVHMLGKILTKSAKVL